MSALRAAGARVDDARLPSSVGAAVDRPAILPVDLLATLGADTFRAVRGEVDPAIAQRLERVLTASTGSVRNQRSSEDAYASAVVLRDRVRRASHDGFMTRLAEGSMRWSVPPRSFVLRCCHKRARPILWPRRRLRRCCSAIPRLQTIAGSVR